MPLGPVQLLVVGFDRPNFSGEVLAELERLRASDIVRVIDLLVVHKRADGLVQRLHHSDLTAAEGAGAVVGALIGLDAAGQEGADAGALHGAARIDAKGGHLREEEFWSLDEAIPNDSAAAIALVEHRWASGVRDAIRAAGGVPVADAWIHPDDLAAAGLIDAEDAPVPDG
jgi:uncharacterized membrane protein